MKREFLPYYISRAILSSLFALLIFGFTWKALLFLMILFGFFLLYLHSGWFRVDLSNPLLPLRRDSHAQSIQRKALIVSIGVGLLTYISLPYLSNALGMVTISGNIALGTATIAYFASQFMLFVKA
jgi:hypothetical protein